MVVNPPSPTVTVATPCFRRVIVENVEFEPPPYETGEHNRHLLCHLNLVNDVDCGARIVILYSLSLVFEAASLTLSNVEVVFVPTCIV